MNLTIPTNTEIKVGEIEYVTNDVATISVKELVPPPPAGDPQNLSVTLEDTGEQAVYRVRFQHLGGARAFESEFGQLEFTRTPSATPGGPDDCVGELGVELLSPGTEFALRSMAYADNEAGEWVSCIVA